jgi:hypothetical protein
LLHWCHTVVTLSDGRPVQHGMPREQGECESSVTMM